MESYKENKVETFEQTIAELLAKQEELREKMKALGVAKVRSKENAGAPLGSKEYVDFGFEEQIVELRKESEEISHKIDDLFCGAGEAGEREPELPLES